MRFMIILVGIMPFRVLYVFSDAMFFVIYHVIGYRRNVVLVNLCNSFPEKNAGEIHSLTKKFYQHLCDITLESIKGFTMSPQEIICRHRILNPELADYHFDKGISAISVPGHYNNWEWGSLSPGLQLKYPIVGFYKCMSNSQVDTFVKSHRARFNTRLASLKETSVTFKELSPIPHAYIMASDQSPTNLKECYWIDFLNQDTAWLHGPEKYARRYNLPVIYVDIQKVKRGFYELKLVLLTEDPSSLPEGEITRLYTQHLEKSILDEPAYWLWSHKRWKHKRERG
ncbi:MAG: lysophospholipid acyltransferase family protein [Bacteroidales bacterium]|nr:lysophospholipid acyltransferase family protein [Bacteroidales bacterium]